MDIAIFKVDKSEDWSLRIPIIKLFTEKAFELLDPHSIENDKPEICWLVHDNKKKTEDHLNGIVKGYCDWHLAYQGSCEKGYSGSPT